MKGFPKELLFSRRQTKCRSLQINEEKLKLRSDDRLISSSESSPTEALGAWGESTLYKFPIFDPGSQGSLVDIGETTRLLNSPSYDLENC